MSVIELVGEKTEDLFRMEVRKGEPIGGRAVGSHEEGEEMLDYLDDEIAEMFLVFARERYSWVFDPPRKFQAAKAEVGAVVGQGGIGNVR
jgi:hypothetical protein